MEKFMDPNRPYKCDVCKESFTQKNILLVHYNSVSHLHKSKQVQINTTSPTSSAESPAPAHTSSDAVSMVINSVSSSTPTSTTSSNENKPYKCNICKVAYSQGSTLDIHIRSVLHQTRATKLQELAMTGQVDVNQPLIEQPDHPKAVEQASTHRRILADMLLHKQPPMSTVLTNGHPVFFSGPVTPSTPTSSSSNQSALSPGGKPVYSCNKCSAIFMNQEALFSHPCFQQVQLAFPSNIPPAVFQQMMRKSTSSNPNTTNVNSNTLQRTKPQVHKNLLENFGFECVMQYNEFMQKIKNDDDKDIDRIKEENLEIKIEVDDDVDVSKKIKKEKEDEDRCDDMPEINRAKCPKCKKEFSSIWVLKAHQEEIHKEFVPLDFVEDCGEQIKDDLQKKVEVNTSENSQDDSQPPPLPAVTPNSSSEITIKTEPSASTSSEASPNQMPTMIPMSLGMPIAMAMQPPLMPVMVPTSENMPFPSPTLPNVVEANMMAAQRMQQQNQSQLNLSNQKRARTRINDEQLKILRGYFDINNSPTEEQVQVMSDQSGLPQKVIKHWFRNTLFKERQRNKDSPYNFNNPPSTTLNLEEYEKTGKIQVEQVPEDANKKNDSDSSAETGSVVSGNEVAIKLELESPAKSPVEPMELKIHVDDITPQKRQFEAMDSISQLAQMKVEPVTLPPMPIMPPLVLTPMPATSPRVTHSPGVSGGLTPSFTPNSSFTTSPIPMMRPEGNQHSPTPCSMAMSRRANRTRFTDYQIKILQEYFEQNAYPKDDDLEHMSKILSLSPRVIVVWFQNARQKARKVYENQPAPEGDESSNSRFQRTPGSNYQCKKCLTVFQRYYELIKHQKKHCFKDEDIPPCQVFGDDVMSNSSSYMRELNDNDSDNDMDDKSQCSSTSPSTSKDTDRELFKCDKCSLSFPRFELWREHQSVHAMNQPMFPSFPAESAFGLLQNIAQQQQQRQQAQQQINRDLEKAGVKRKSEEEESQDDQPRDKRLRTTILPEQLDYLYQKYQLDCNPSRKQLETIAHDVGLKKRVVQVWFQNTRARERKGQYRAHQQLIHKRCPFCRALFRAKSALESHLATKHPEEMAKSDINIDNIPDAQPESPSSTTPVSSSPGIDISKMMSNPFSLSPFMPMLPPGFTSANDPMQLQMKRFYEESLKKYVEDCSKQQGSKSEFPKSSTQSRSGDEAPLDLSKPLKLKSEPLDEIDAGYDMSSRNDSDSESYSDLDDSHSVNPSSPNGLHRSPGGTPKRFRTQMTSLQIRIMKQIYLEYKTPTMAECESLGRDIGLPKRVIQVWFQNARAKEKKAKFGFGTGKPYVDELPVQHNDDCKLCDFKYTHKYSVQDHIFTKSHIDNMKKHIQSQLDGEQIRADAVTLVRQQEMEKAQQRGSSENTDSSSALSQANLAQLQAMGLPVSAALGIPGFLGGLPPGSFHPGLMPPEVAAKLAKEGVKVKDEPKDGEKTTDKNDNNSKWPYENAMTPQLMGPVFPGMESGLLPFMYPGMPGLYPGMGLSLMQPGLFPGEKKSATPTSSSSP